MKKILLFICLFSVFSSYAQRNKTEANVTGRFYYVKDYGAKGDSTTDDRAAIIRCFTAAKADSSAIVFFADGRYLISDSIMVPPGLTIMGTSTGKNALDRGTSIKSPTGSVIIVNSTSHIGFVINSAGIWDAHLGVVKPVQIQGLSFWNVSSSTPTSTSAGILVRDYMQFTLRDLQIQGFYINLNVVSGVYWTADNCRFADAVQYQMSIGDIDIPDNGDQFVNNCLFETLLTRSCRAHIYYHGGGGLKITNCKLNKWDSDDNNRATFGILVEQANITSDFFINNTSIENYDSSAILINQVGSIFYNILIDNVQMATSIAKGSPIKIVGLGSGDFGLVTITNYTINDYGTSTNANPWISLTNTNYVNIGPGAVRFYASPSVTGGTNIRYFFDAQNGYMGINTLPTSNLQVQNSGTAATTVYAINNQTAQSSSVVEQNDASNYLAHYMFGSAFSGASGGISNDNMGELTSNKRMLIGPGSNDSLYFMTNNILRLKISGGGNVKFGTSGPLYTNSTNSWDFTGIGRQVLSANTSNSQFQIGGIELQGYAVNNSQINENTYYNGSNQVYRANGFASLMSMSSGNVNVQTAPSGTAGATATFTVNAAFLNGGNTVFGSNSDQSGSIFQVAGSESHKYRAITALRTLDATDHIINCTANSFTVTLPTAVGCTGREYIIKNTGTATTITIATTSSQTIDGTTPGTITTLIPLRVVSDGANWITF